MGGEGWERSGERGGEEFRVLADYDWVARFNWAPTVGKMGVIGREMEGMKDERRFMVS